jgi:hypothetical protein
MQILSQHILHRHSNWYSRNDVKEEFYSFVCYLPLFHDKNTQENVANHEFVVYFKSIENRETNAKK